MARRKEIYEELYPETRRGAVNQYTKSANPNNSEQHKAFTEDVAQKLNISRDTIENEIKIAKNILPEVQKVIKEKDIPKTQALKEGETTKPAQNLAEGINWANQIDLSPIRLY